MKYIVIVALIFSILLGQNIPQSLAFEVDYEVHGPIIIRGLNEFNQKKLSLLEIIIVGR